MRDALPNASFIAFTGTPLELQDRNTRLVFGDYISVYDLVPIYYESRRAKLDLDERERPKIDLFAGVRDLSRAVAPEGVVDLFEAAGLKKPDISILSEEFLAEVLGLSKEELAFYDALETNDSAVKVLGDATLRAIARELVQTVRRNATLDWTLRENVRAHTAQVRLCAG